MFPSVTDYTNDDVLNDHLNYLWNGFYIVHTAMPFLIYELAINPDVQTSLFNEIRARNEQQGKFGYVDLSELKYMDNVISESLRLWSPAQFTRKYIDTTTIEHFENVKVDPNFMELNVGDSIIIPTHALHMDEQYFLNPEKFDPSRFDGNAIKDGTFYPFGCEKGMRWWHIFMLDLSNCSIIFLIFLFIAFRRAYCIRICYIANENRPISFDHLVCY